MCGLIAYYKTSCGPLAPELLEKMTHALVHRGPDDYGLCFATAERTHVWLNVAFGDGPWGEETFFSGINAVEPGTYLVFKNGRAARKTRFWDLPVRRDERSMLRSLSVS